MARYPFLAFVERYLASIDGVYSPRFVEDVRNRYKRQARTFLKLKNDGLVTSTSPQQFTAEDIRVFLVHRKSKGAKPADLRKDIAALRKLCESCDNTSVNACMTKFPALLPRVHDGGLPAMSDRDFRTFVESLSSVPEEWKHLRAYCMVGLFLSCGCRTNELRLMNVSDIHLDSFELDILHPKGENTYGSSRSVPIPPFIRGVLLRYLALRKEWPATSGRVVPALFPSYESDDGYMSDKQLRVIRLLVCSELGIHFDFRMCRRTFGQNYIDANLSVESVSVLMGHCTTKTTESFYCRQKNRVAIDNAKGVWGSEPASKGGRKNDAGLKIMCSHRESLLILSDSFILSSILPIELRCASATGCDL